MNDAKKAAVLDTLVLKAAARRDGRCPPVAELYRAAGETGIACSERDVGLAIARLIGLRLIKSREDLSHLALGTEKGEDGGRTTDDGGQKTDAQAEGMEL